MIGVFFYLQETSLNFPVNEKTLRAGFFLVLRLLNTKHELPSVASERSVAEREECMSSQRVKKELYETAMTGEKALTSLMYVQMTLYAAKSQKTYARVRSEGRARMRHTGLHMNQYLRAAGKDLESFRNRLKETHLPEELQSKAETFLVQTVHVLDVTEKKQMYRGELIGLEEKVKEIAEQIEELLKSMRELGV